jgi:hypothetical protein
MPSTVVELKDFLQAAHPEWRVQPNIGDAHMERSVYLLAPSYSLNRFPPSFAPSNQENWRGAVLIQMPRGWQAPANEWGDCALEVGPFLIYGDRAMLAEINKCIRSQVDLIRP